MTPDEQLAIFNKPDWLTNFRNAATAIMTALAQNGATVPDFQFNVDGVPCCVTPMSATHMRAQVGTTDGSGWQIDLVAPAGWFMPNPSVAAPWDLSDQVTPGHVVLSWRPSNTPGVTYNIYRDEVEIGSVAVGILTYDDTTAAAGSSHSYTVRAVKPDGTMSADSVAVTAVAQ